MPSPQSLESMRPFGSTNRVNGAVNKVHLVAFTLMCFAPYSCDAASMPAGLNLTSDPAEVMAAGFPDTFQYSCKTCRDLTSGPGGADTVCTCIEDPYDVVNVLKSVPEIKVTLVTYALCMVLGIGGNLITLVTMATADRKNKSVTNLFLISLAVRPFFFLHFIFHLNFSATSFPPFPSNV